MACHSYIPDIDELWVGQQSTRRLTKDHIHLEAVQCQTTRRSSLRAVKAPLEDKRYPGVQRESIGLTYQAWTSDFATPSLCLTDMMKALQAVCCNSCRPMQLHHMSICNSISEIHLPSVADISRSAGVEDTARD
jgi:hypothetical protein